MGQDNFLEFSSSHDTLKVRENLNISIPRSAIGMFYKPEDAKPENIEDDTKITHVEFVFQNEVDNK